MTTERRDLALAELLPGLYTLILRHGRADDKGYVLRRNLGIAEGTLLVREILAPGNATAWLATLLLEPWLVVALEPSQLHGIFNVVLPDRESGWPE